MADDMKKQIAESTVKLLFQDKRSKITVTDIVNESCISRQSFCYHFQDVPDVIK